MNIIIFWYEENEYVDFFLKENMLNFCCKLLGDYNFF